MKIKQKIKPILTLIMKLFGLFPIKNNKVVFSSFSAGSFSDNPKYIAEELLKENLAVDCVVVLRNTKRIHLPDGIRYVKYNTLRYLFELSTARVWVDNTRKQDFIVKRKGQYYIQTWHGAIPFKGIEHDIAESLSTKYINIAKHDSQLIDCVLTNSDLGKEIIKKSFWYDGPVIKTGSPRLDKLISKDSLFHDEAKQKLNLKTNVKYLLYAPTFRDSGDISVYNINFSSIINSLERRFGGDWNVIVKLHPNIKDEHIKISKNVINATQFPDIIELFSVADVLITDYSSSMFEFALTKKPVLLYMPDIDDYLKYRSTYFEIEELPFKVANNLHELSSNIIGFNTEQYHTELDKFYKKLHLLEDGNASQRVVDIIKKQIC
ncbi:CDP-glycerol glycerophosphotransferase family protein [Lactiplantibacillus modestisalitolerans]|nr:CDP-glycerol glycerophosphotransferase family protein [Lactiplantibacillus modestisalitolerans]